MKKVCTSILLFCILLGLAACATTPTTEPSTEPPTAPSVSEPTTPQPSEPPAQAPMFSISLPIIQHKTNHQDGTVLFTLTYQDLSLILPDPDVAEKVIIHYLNHLDTVDREAQNICAAAESNYHGQTQWHPYSCTSLCDVKRIDNNVLSLHGSYSSYNGTSHPTHITQSINYNLITGDSLALDTVLADSSAVDHIRQLLIARLRDMQKDTQLYPDFADIITDLLGFGDFSNWYFSEEGLCFCFSPYEIAPYTSGIIEVAIPYSQLQGILDDAYFPMEWAYEGNVSVELFNQTDIDRFTQTSELTLHPEGEQILLHSGNTAVSNVIIEYGAVSTEGTRFVPEATIFACATLTPGDAVLMNVSLSDVSPVLRITYRSGTQTITKYIFQSGEDGSIELIDL